jgi:hypothetical protein
MEAHGHEEVAELQAAADEARALHTPLMEQLERVRALQQTQPTPALASMAKGVHALYFLLWLEDNIIRRDLSALARYRQLTPNSSYTQVAIGELLGSYGLKEPMYFRISAMADDLVEAIPFYAKARDYTEMVRLIQETKREAFARQHNYFNLLDAAKKPFDEQHIKEFTAIRTFRLPVNIDFAALRRTLTDVVDMLEPIRQLARLLLPLNARLLGYRGAGALRMQVS